MSITLGKIANRCILMYTKYMEQLINSFQPLPSERVKMNIKNMGMLTNLPKGYAFKGGAARYIAQLQLGKHPDKPRDIDLIFMGDLADRNKRFEAILNPDDTGDGHYADKLTNTNKYFDECDFTINELMVVKNTLIATKQSINDLTSFVIRPSKFEKSKSTKLGLLTPKLKIKSIYMLVKMLWENPEQNWQIADDDILYPEMHIDDMEYDHLQAPTGDTFWICVFLDRLSHYKSHIIYQHFVIF